MAEQGLSLNINESVLKKLEEADKKLESIVRHSEEVSKFTKKISSEGLKSVVLSLGEMNSQLNNIAKSKTFQGMNTQASQSVDAINKMVAALARLTTQQQIRLQTQQAKVDYKKEANDIKEVSVAENERARALDRLNRANASNDKRRQSVLTKQLANDTQELMNKEQERGRRLLLQNMQNITAYTKETVKIKQQIDEIKRLAAAYKAMPKSIKQSELNKLITGASRAKTINQHITAIHNLQNALRDLDTNSKKYKDNVRRINDELIRNRTELAKLGVNIDNVKRKKRQLMDTAGQLGRSLALVFSVSHVIGYMNKLVNIRREMELQHKSLQVLLQDRYEADKLWQQTIDLAVRSPFRVKELVTYTRQLAAYRIETENLHDTTKRLADVSAGLGVDMQRLILAYGQVRAAEYLRGTELRQFSEAGIPMLDELAKHFEDLEGRAVSAGDVFERVSKRMVSFEDVNQVFQRMTNEGGVFFQMQEKQAETLHGIISNFHDSVDLMLNDIGEANDGTLKGTVLMFRSFVENWRVFAEILKQIGTVAGVLLLRKSLLNLLALSPQIHGLAANLQRMNVINRALNVSLIRLGGAFKALGAAMLTPTGIIVSSLGIIASAISAMIAYNKAIDANNQKYDEMSEREVAAMKKLDDLIGKIKEQNAILEDSEASIKAKTKAEKENSRILSELQQKYPEMYSGLKQQENGTIDATKAIEEQNAMLRVNIALQQAAKGSLLQQDFSKNYKDALEDYKDLEKVITDIQGKSMQLMVNLSNSFQKGDINKETHDYLFDLADRLSKEKSLDGIMALRQEISEFQKTLLGTGQDYNEVVDLIYGVTVHGYTKLESAQRDYNASLDDWFDNIDNQMNAFRVGVQSIIDNYEDKNLGKIFAGDFITRELEKLGVANEELMKQAQEYVKSQLSVDVVFASDGKPVYDLSEEWRKKVWDAIQAVENTNPDIRLGVAIKEMATKDKSELIKKLKDSVANAIKINDETIEVGKIETQIAFTDEQIKAAEETQPLLKFLSDLVGIIEKTNTGGSNAKDWVSELVRGVREAHKEYLNLNKTLDEASAKEMTLAKYANLFKEASKHTRFKDWNLEDVDFTSEAGTIKALEDMLNELPESAKNARLSIQKALTEIRGEQTIALKVEEDKKLVDKIEEMFSGYELSLELEKLNIPPDLAKRLFDIDAIDLSGLKSRVEGFESMFIGTDMESKYKEYLQKISEMEDKEQIERLKSYTKYIVKAQSERTRITFEALEKIRKAEEMYKQGNFDDNEMINIRENINKERDEELAKLSFDEFKNSDLYIKMFEDLDSVSIPVLEAMKDKVENLRSSLKELGASSEDVKNLTQQLEKIDDAIQKRKPFKDFFDNLKSYIKLQGERDEIEEEYGKKLKENTELTKTLAEASKEVGIAKSEYNNAIQVANNKEPLKNAQSELDIAKARLAIEVNSNGAETQKAIALQKEVEEKQKLYDLTYKTLVLEDASVVETSKRLQNAQEAEETAKDSLKKSNTDLSSLLDKLKEAEEVSEKIAATLQYIGEVFGELGSTIDSVASSMENVFGGMDEKTSDTVNSITEIIGGLGETASGVGRVLLNPADIGGYLQAVRGIASTIGSIFNIGDKSNEREIQREIKLVEDLERAYERLEKQIDEAYTVDTLKRSFDNATKNLNSQISARQRMIQAEEDKKKTDKNRIEEWKKEIEDLREQQKELLKTQVEELGGGYDYRSMTEEFVDAWVKAYEEAGEGLSGLEENFDDFFKNIAIKQAVMGGASKILEPFFNQVNKAIENDFKIDDSEMAVIDQLGEQAKVNLDEFLKQWYGKWGEYISSGEGELSGLQRGIQSVSESTAQIIEAYLNSVRFYVADNNTKLTQLVNQVVGGGNTPNPILSELKTQTELVRGISTLLNSVVRGSHSMGGQGIKVFIS